MNPSAKTDFATSGRFEFQPGVIRFGPGCVEDLADELDSHGVSRALVVSGRTTGTTPAVIEPVEAGLGEYHAGTAAVTTPEKRLDTAFEIVDQMNEYEADALVSLGAGSSIDLTKVASVLASRSLSRNEAGKELEETGSISVPDEPVVTHVAVPTTLSGADLSMGGGVNALPESGLVSAPTNGGVYGSSVMPTGLFYDSELFETTPIDILAGSVMNGFDKGIESLYASNGIMLTDATAIRGLSLLQEALPHLRDDNRDEEVLEQIVQGIVLVQYGIWGVKSMATLSIIHAFGHGVTSHSDAHQGNVHATVAPHVLRYVFENVDGRRYLIADALGVSTDGPPEEVAEGIVAAVTEIRDALELPTQLGTLAGVEEDALPVMAEAVHADWCMNNTPEGLETSREDVAGILRNAW